VTAAVTGATGHLGAALVRLLLAERHRVRALVHDDARGLQELGVTCHAGDVRDATSLQPAFRGADVVFHLAARISITGSQGGEVERINVEGARNAAGAARDAGVVRFVHVSSVHAFDHAACPLTESAPRPGPAHPAYDRSKAAGEVAVRSVPGVDVVVANPSGIIGPWDARPSRMGRALVHLAKGRVPALLEGGFDWVDSRDVAASLLAMAERGKVGENYLLGGRWASMREVAELVHAAGGAPPPRFTTPRWVARATAPVAELLGAWSGQEPLYTPEALHALFGGSRAVSWEKAAAELGHSPRPLEVTVSDTLASFREMGLLA
jgi:dihydroflavonol-4-reductase